MDSSHPTCARPVGYGGDSILSPTGIRPSLWPHGHRIGEVLAPLCVQWRSWLLPRRHFLLRMPVAIAVFDDDFYAGLFARGGAVN